MSDLDHSLKHFVIMSASKQLTAETGPASADGISPSATALHVGNLICLVRTNPGRLHLPQKQCPTANQQELPAIL